MSLINPTLEYNLKSANTQKAFEEYSIQLNFLHRLLHGLNQIGFWTTRLNSKTPIDTSEEVYFYADSKYVSYIKFSPTHQKLGTSANLPYFWKKGGGNL